MLCVTFLLHFFCLSIKTLLHEGVAYNNYTCTIPYRQLKGLSMVVCMFKVHLHGSVGQVLAVAVSMILHSQLSGLKSITGQLQ